MTSPITADLAKRRLIRVNTGTDALPSWLSVASTTNYVPRLDVTKQDGTTYDDALYKGIQVTTQMGWGGALTILRLRNAAVEDPGQKFMRLAAIPQTATGVPSAFGIQIVDRFGGPDENIQGKATCTWEPQGGDATVLETINVTIDGIGFAAPITNPLAAAIVPVVVGASPSGAGTGAQVSIFGSGFSTATGAAAVKFGAVNASSYVVVSDGLIIAVVPSGSAGSAPITVTTPGGTSNALAYTRAA